MKPPLNRMSTPETRDTKPMPVAAETVPVSDPPLTVKCPHCGAARTNQWDKYSGGRDGSEPYKQCRSCGSKYVFLANGTMRLVG